MAKQIVNVGVLPNDGQGDNLRAGATKLNNNFKNYFKIMVLQLNCTIICFNSNSTIINF